MFYLRTIPRRRPYFSPGLFGELKQAVLRGESSFGDPVKSLEKSLDEILGLPNAIVTGSGRMALRLILECSDLEKGAEVIVPGYTFAPVYDAIRSSGFSPVGVDVDPRTFEMDPQRVADALTPRTGAILATHLFGEPCDMDSILEIAKENSLLVVEDSAQAVGAVSRGRAIGTIGDAGFASFDMSKNLQGFRGGALFGTNEELIAKIRKRVEQLGAPEGSTLKEMFMRYIEHSLIQSPFWRIPIIFLSFEKVQNFLFGLYRKPETAEKAVAMVSELGPAVLPELNAIVVRKNVDSLPQRIERRRAIRVLYKEQLEGVLDFQEIDPENQGSVHMLVARPGVDIFGLRRYLAFRGIDIAVGDEISDDCLKREGTEVGRLFREAITLPVHEMLSDRDVINISSIVKSGVEKLRK